MFPDDLFAFILEQLAGEIAQRETPRPDPIRTDSYVARSVMQKAIRRGLIDLALRAAATLMAVDRRALWRRLLVTAIEDLGIGEVDLTARIVASSRDRSWRESVGGDWPVICTLLAQACAGTRDQAANDLWNIAKNDPALDAFKAALCEAGLSDLLSIMTDEAQPPEQRAVTVLIALGEDAGPAPVHIAADPGAIFSAFAAAGRYSHVAAIYEAAFRQTRLALSPLNLCLWPESRSVELDGVDDKLPPVAWIGDVPTYGLDQYTRPGLEAIRRFSYANRPWRDFAERWNLPRSDWPRATGELLFRLEGAVVTNRRTWTVGAQTYRRSSTLGCFMPEAAVPEAMELIRREGAHIDQMRNLTYPPTT